ncbi:MAG: hypothetical protein RIB46_08480 [Pseudomonadales bacterium]
MTRPAERHTRGRLGSALLLLGMAGWAPWAAAQTTVRAELAGTFHETVQEEVSVSGSVVVGVAAGSALSGPAALSGLIIPTTAERICLTVLSRDGVYFSRNTFLVPAERRADDAAFVLLPYEGTKRRELVLGFGPGELAVRATPGDCEAAGSTYLVAADREDFDSVQVLINAFGATAVYFRTADGMEADCEEFVEGRRTSYDYRCEIPVAALGKGRQVVFIDRERYGRPLGEVEIELQLSSEP